MGSAKLVLAICLHDDALFLPSVIGSTSGLQTIVFVDELAWHGPSGDWQASATLAKGLGATVVTGEWPDESVHRRFALEWLRAQGHKHVLILDSDEVVEPQLRKTLKEIAALGLAERVYVHMDTYWKSPQYVIRPRERLTPVAMIDVQQAEHVHIRDYAGGRAMILGPEYGVIHHLSYAGPDERIQRKVSSWSHRDEVVQDWYRRVWQGWDSDKLMRDLHPTHPQAYGFAERIPTPEILEDCWDDVPLAVDPEVSANWPSV